MATIADVARHAGVSTASVSRALSGRAGVSPAVRERVLRSATALSYRPNAIARSLRMDTTQTIGLIVSDVMNPFFGELAYAIEEEAHRQGLSIILCNANEDTARQDEYIDLLLGRRVDGLLLTPALRTSPALAAAAERGTPMVFVDRAVPGAAAPVVRADGSRATAELVEHLVRLGHERLAVIAGPQQTLTGRERLRAFRAAVRGHGLPLPRTRVCVGDFRMDSGRRAAARLLDLADPPSAVFVADNLMALGAVQEMRDRGVHIGRDVAIAAFDDPPWFRLLDPPLTAVSQPVTEMGTHAVRTLVDLRAGRPVSSLTLDCRLVVRASCGEGDSPAPRPAGPRPASAPTPPALRAGWVSTDHVRPTRGAKP